MTEGKVPSSAFLNDGQARTTCDRAAFGGIATRKKERGQILGGIYVIASHVENRILERNFCVIFPKILPFSPVFV